jgi:hypothetical protein
MYAYASLAATAQQSSVTAQTIICQSLQMISCQTLSAKTVSTVFRRTSEKVTLLLAVIWQQSSKRNILIAIHGAGMAAFVLWEILLGFSGGVSRKWATRCDSLPRMYSCQARKYCSPLRRLRRNWKER